MQGAKEKSSDNLGHICKTSDISEKFLFTTSKAVLDIFHKKHSIQVASRVYWTTSDLGS